MLESATERAFVRRVRRLSRVHVLKLNLQGRRGWPDRLILMPGGRAVFIEFKRVGEVPRPLQEHVHNAIRELGFYVHVCDDAVEAFLLIQSHLKEESK